MPVASVIAAVEEILKTLRDREELRKYRCVASEFFSASALYEKFLKMLIEDKGLTYAEATLFLRRSRPHLTAIRESFYQSVDRNVAWALDKKPHVPQRYNTSEFGAFYTAKEIETAISERKYHYDKLPGNGKKNLRYTVYSVHFSGQMIDFRTIPAIKPDLTHGSDYSNCQFLASEVRKSCDAIAVQSVRALDGNCCPIFAKHTIDPIDTEVTGEFVAEATN